jgi:Co/Zn/Cd efflux system component
MVEKDETEFADDILISSETTPMTGTTEMSPINLTKINLFKSSNEQLPLFERERLQALRSNNQALRKLVLVVIITVFFVAIEICGGLLAHSIAIMSDAAHLVSDALGILISIVALKIAERDANDVYTFGYQRAEVLGALTSILFIWGVTIWLMVEATFRLM